MNELKSIELKNKKGEVLGTYVEVHERIRYFRQAPEYYGWSLISKIVWNATNDKQVTIEATIINQFGIEVATGLAMERVDSNFINQSSHIENCETSAWGRALGCLGIGITEHVRTKEEMESALLNQEPMSEEQRKKISKLMQTLDKSVPQNTRAKIFSDMHTFTPERAQQCIDFLEANQRELLAHYPNQGDITTATGKAVDKDDFYEKKKKPQKGKK